MNETRKPADTTLDRSALWDQWCQARRVKPGLSPREFLESRLHPEPGQLDPGQLEDLELMVAIEASSPPSSLVDALTAEPNAEGEASGVRFAGYILEESLGQGSSGIVYRARKLDTSSPPVPGTASTQSVALKILNPLLAASPTRRDSILREAQIAATLDHPNIVRVHASGMERGYAWIATEYAPGATLDGLIEESRSAVEREALAIRIGLQLASALHHAHTRGIVHRDLKPSNLIWTPDQQLKILDFGLARTQGTAFSVSRTGEIVGTPLYMAPEQARGEGRIGPATDIFAIGLILYELGCGARLQASAPLHQLISQLAAGRGSTRRMRLSCLSPGLRAIVRRATEAHPSDRYADCLQLAADLEDLQASRPLRFGTWNPLQRFARKLGRNQLATTASLLCFGALTYGAQLAWHHRPVPVTFTTVDDGKRIWIDDELEELSTARMYLLPGTHRYRTQFATSKYIFEGEFEVEPGKHSRITKIQSPWYGVPHTPDLGTALVPGNFAWVVLANPAPRIQLSINGADHGEQPGICAFVLPLGKHRIDARLDGYHPYSQEIEIRTQDLCFLPFEFDRTDSDWRTQIIYSPLDYALTRHVVKQERLRLHVEKESLTNTERTFVRKAYLGPDSDFQTGTLLLRLPIPQGSTDLELGGCKPSFATSLGGPSLPIVSRILVGWSPEALIDLGREWLPQPPDAAGFELHMESLRQYLAPRELLEPVVRGIRGQRYLYVQCEVGGCEAGEDIAYAFALRTNALPERLEDGRLAWQPGLRIRTKR